MMVLLGPQRHCFGISVYVGFQITIKASVRTGVYQMSELNEVVIISAARTPVGRFLGSLKGFSAPQLGAIVVREAVKRAGVNPEDVDEVIMGCGIQAGLGQNPA